MLDVKLFNEMMMDFNFNWGPKVTIQFDIEVAQLMSSDADDKEKFITYLETITEYVKEYSR